jgi:hypothetical protein
MNQKRVPPKNKFNQLDKNYQFHFQPRKTLMKTKALRMMELTRSKRTRSNQRGLMRRKVKRSKMVLILKLKAFTLRISTWTLVFPYQNPVFQLNRIS